MQESICDDAYRLIIAKFDVLGYAAAALSMGRRKSLTEEEKGKIIVFHRDDLMM